MSKFEVKRVQQIGLVVKDVAQKIEYYKKMLVLDESQIYILNSSTTDLGFKKKRYHGKDVDFDLIIGVLDVGGVQFELIQPLNKSGDPYSDFLKKNGEGIHHVSIVTADKKANDFFAVMKEHNEPELIGGTILGLDFSYFNLTDKLGLVFEVAIKSSDTN